MNATQTSLITAMHRHGVTSYIQRYEGLQTSDDGWKHNLYRFGVSINGEEILSNAPFRAGTGIDSVDGTDCFEAILADSRSVAGYDDWAEWADELGIVEDAKSAKKAQQDFYEISARRTLMVERLGEDVVAELEEIES